MKLSNIRVIAGPNHFSQEHNKLIVACFDDIDTLPDTDWATELSKLFPGNESFAAGSSYTALDLIGEIALALQKCLGFTGKFHKVFTDEKGCEHQLVFEYEEINCGRRTAEIAFGIYSRMRKGEPVHTETYLSELNELLVSEKLGPSTMSIYKEANRRGIPVMRLNEYSLLQLGYGAKQKRVEATLTGGTSSIAVDIAGDKHRAKQILRSAYIPAPNGVVIREETELGGSVRKIGFPLVIKPLDGNQGKGATVNINSIEEARKAFQLAKQISNCVVVEQFVSGKDFRILLVDHKLVAAAVRMPASVVGDGKHSIRQLIEIENKDERRGDGHCNVLTKLSADKITEDFLAKNGKDLEAIPEDGETVFLRSTANLSTGGTAEDVTDIIHPANVSLFERASRVVGLDICGLDVMATDLTTPITENGGSIIEVNAAPGIRMHLQPSKGKPRNVAGPIVDMLFPPNENGRIPIVAVTGTNGKTTTTRLIACMAQQHGYQTGFTTTDGIYLNKELIHKGDCSGPQSAKFILKEPTVEFAVLETARGGIIRSGLGFDSCDCAVITNVAEDHLGLNAIHTVEQLANVKATVGRAVRTGGWVVLNADDDRVYAMRNEVKGNVALFSMHPDSRRIIEHCESGGVAAICDEGFIMIRQGNRLMPIEEIENVPLTYGGKAKFNVANVLGATLASWLMHISLPAIRCSLRNFRNTTESTPGRLNVFDFGDFNVIMDYAHNPHGLKALGEFILSLPATRRIGVITAVGDRRNEDIIGIGQIAGRLFDGIIIRMDEDLRGRTEFELCSLLRSGIQRSAPDKPLSYFSSEAESVEYAIKTAPSGSIVVLLVENIRQVSEKIRELKELRKGKSSEMRVAV